MKSRLSLRGWQGRPTGATMALAAALAFSMVGLIQPTSAQEATTFTADQAVVVDADSLNLRLDSLLSSESVAVLQNGTWATVIDGPVTADGYDWYQLEYDGVTGWAAGEFLVDAATDVIANGDTVIVNTEGLNLRGSAGSDTEILSILVAGEEGTVAAGPEKIDGTNWYQIDFGGTTGWLVRDYLALPAAVDATGGATPVAATTPVMATVNETEVTMRETAGLDGAVVTYLSTGATVTLSGTTEDVDGFTWYQVETSDGLSGWIAGDFLQI